MSRSMAVAADGYSAEQVDKEIAADNARADEMGLIFDGDPRKTNGSGGLQGQGGAGKFPPNGEDRLTDPFKPDEDEALARALIAADEREEVLAR
jgi:hypothetical protein